MLKKTKAYCKRLNIQLVQAVIILSLIISFTGYYYYSQEKKIIQKEKYRELKAIAELKAEELTRWQKERVEEARYFSTSLPFRQYVAEIAGGKKDHSGILKSSLSKFISYNDYDNILIIDREGRIIFSVTPETYDTDAQTRTQVNKAFETGDITITDFYFSEISKKIHFEIIAPVDDEKMRSVAALIFCVNPDGSLYPIIQKWPSAGKTGETVLVRREGDSVRYLNDLRHMKNSTLQTGFLLTDTEKPAVRAIMGQKGMFEGPDYSGRKVLGDISNIPGTPWYMIVKEDIDEVYAVLGSKAMLITIITVLSILFAGVAIAWFYYNRQRNIYKELLEKSTDLYLSQKELGTTLYSIADGVITTDKKGLVKHMNPVAEKLTGWKEEEAKGRYIEEVFTIINEDTREKVESPVEMVIRKGNKIVFSGHTLLVSRDGSLTPIGNSGAPIIDEKDDFLGVVLVFSDQREEHFNRKILEIRLNTFAFAASHSLEETLTRMLDEIGVMTQSPLGFLHFVTPDQKSVSLQAWSTETLRNFCKADKGQTHYKIESAGVWADCIRERKPVTHNDYTGLIRKKGLPEGHAEIIRELVVPVFRNNSIVAVLGIGNKPTDYTSQDVKIVTFLADVTWEIAESKIKEENLKQSEERFYHLFERAPLGYQSLNEDGNFIEINKAWTDTLGYERKEVIGKWFGNFLAPEYVELFKEKFPVFKIKGKIHSEFEMIHKSGERRFIAFDGRAGYNEAGKFEKTHCILKDITEARQAEKKLIESESKYRNIFNNHAAVKYIFDPESQIIIDANKSAADFYGWKLEDFKGLKLSEINTMSEKEIAVQLKTDMGREKNNFQNEFIHRKSDGTKVTVEVFSSIISIEGNDYIHSIVHDISGKKKTEQALKNSEETMRLLLNSAGEGIYGVDVNGECMFCNKSALSLLGYEREEEIIGKKLHDLIHHTRKDGSRITAEECRIMKAISEGTDSYSDEDVFWRKNNTCFPVEYWSYPMKRENEIIGTVVTFLDISQKKYDEDISQILYKITRTSMLSGTLEELMKVVRDEISKVIDATNFYVALYNRASNTLKRIVFFNEMIDLEEWDAGTSFSGYVARTKSTLLVKKNERERFIRDFGIKPVEKPAESWLGVPLISKDNILGVVVVQSYSNPDAYDSKSVIFMEMIAHELTAFIQRANMIEDLIEAKKRAEESDRLKSAFIANISHEIRTPMNAIIGFLELLSEPGLEENEKETYMEIMKKGSQRLLTTINAIIEISKIESGHVEVKYSDVDMNEVMSYFYGMYSSQAVSKGVRLILSDETHWNKKLLIKTDRPKVEGILSNLLSNAVKFTSKGSVEFGFRMEDNNIVIYVKDTGPGIPEDKREEIFNRFVMIDSRLTRNHEGSGLGLSIVKYYVQTLEGTIKVESEEGKGSNFIVKIPLAS
jgi:PAS domain S-box-containing protein